MTISLRSTLNELAESFADRVLEAIRRTSLDELIQSDGQPRAQVRSGQVSTAAPATAPTKKPGRSNGRLHRRSPEEIAAAVNQVVALVKKHKEGLRAEQIRSELGLQAKEMPRILKDGYGKKSAEEQGSEAGNDLLRNVMAPEGSHATARSPI